MIQIQKAKSASSNEKKHWRSVQRLQQGPELIGHEFASDLEQVDEPTRRHWLQIMGASMALAGLAACRRPEERIMPLVRTQEGYLPGEAQFYSTGANFAGRAAGLLVRVNDFRPTKVEGHPQHPANQGRASAYHQSSLLNLYDPERSTYILHKGLGLSETAWDEFQSAMTASAATWGTGAGVRFLSERNPSPSMAALKAFALKKYPEAKWVEYEPALPDYALDGTQLAFGQRLEPVHNFAEARVIVSLDADFLGNDNPDVAEKRSYGRSRNTADATGEMNRLYMVEGQFSITGMNADHRLRLKPSEIEQFAIDLASALGAAPAGLNVLQGGNEKRQKFLREMVKDLQANSGRAAVVAGVRQPARVHALTALINEKLGAIGKTVNYFAPVTQGTTAQVAGIKELIGEMRTGRVDALFILGVNAVFSAPSDLGFAEGLKSCKLVVNLSHDFNETAKAIESAKDSWHIPEAHYLEAWGDVRYADGTATIQQPMIRPLYEQAKSAIEVVAVAVGYDVKRGYDIVRQTWAATLGEDGWKKAVHDGIVPNTTATPVAVKSNPGAVAAAMATRPAATQGIEVQFVPSFNLFDGRFANNAWLQECPDPITKITWGNAALMSPATARKLGVFPDWMKDDKSNGKIGESWDRSMNTEDPAVRITKNGRSIRIPAFVVPGMADDVVTLPLGYGRTQVGTVGKGFVGREIFMHDSDRGKVGVDVYPLRTEADFAFGGGFEVKADGVLPRVATTQDHFEMADRPLAREVTLADYKAEPHIVHEMVHVPDLTQLYPSKDYSKGYQWGMAIDLNACISCNACVVACQAENNIPVVGRDGVIRGREMHWIRIDRYFIGDENEPEAVSQPLPCMHCENAPCENVCPVAATAHSPEGLNDMAYNRCVGTRYCSNNCPYKVRRFNYFNYHRHVEQDPRNEVAKMAYNPDVTVRMRGIMEKCTYCVQRIQNTKIKAKVEGRRKIRDGEIQTACQQTCPTDAIVFGDVNDKTTRVYKLKQLQRNYEMLAEINTRPRTSYLARLRNANPELAGTTHHNGPAHGAPAHGAPSQSAPAHGAGHKEG